jgi:hypothetical protein
MRVESLYVNLSKHGVSIYGTEPDPDRYASSIMTGSWVSYPVTCNCRNGRVQRRSHFNIKSAKGPGGELVGDVFTVSPNR